MESILISIKKLLGITQECTDFDVDIIMHINSTLMVLNQLGLGPSEGFVIFDETATWDQFVPNRQDMEAVKTYVFMKVKLMFDPPTMITVMESMKQLINEFEWRLNVVAESERQEGDRDG